MAVAVSGVVEVVVASGTAVALAVVEEAVVEEAVAAVGSETAEDLADGVLREEGEVPEVAAVEAEEVLAVAAKPSSSSLTVTPVFSSPAARRMPWSLSTSAPATPSTARRGSRSRTRTCRRPTESTDLPLLPPPRLSTESGIPSGKTSCLFS